MEISDVFDCLISNSFSLITTEFVANCLYSESHMSNLGLATFHGGTSESVDDFTTSKGK
jgi:hypothetical protein